MTDDSGGGTDAAGTGGRAGVAGSAADRAVAALLQATDLRVDMGGRVVVETASFVVEGGNAVLIGDGYAVLAAIAGQASIAEGSLLLAGASVATRAHLSFAGLAPLDPPLPGELRAAEYLGWSARLAGMKATEAKGTALAVLSRLGLSSLADTPISRLGAVERRALVLAAAVITDPEIVIAAAPLSGLSVDEARFLFGVFDRACAGRRWLATVGDRWPQSAERLLAQHAAEILLFAAGKLVRRGPLASVEARGAGCELSLLGSAEALAARLALRGLALRGGPGRYFVDLPAPMTPNDLLACSVEANVPIVDLVMCLERPSGC